MNRFLAAVTIAIAGMASSLAQAAPWSISGRQFPNLNQPTTSIEVPTILSVSDETGAPVRGLNGTSFEGTIQYCPSFCNYVAATIVGHPVEILPGIYSVNFSIAANQPGNVHVNNVGILVVRVVTKQALPGAPGQGPHLVVVQHAQSILWTNG